MKRYIKTEPILTKSVGERPLHKRLLVVCEGKNTEHDYFDKFDIPGITIIPIGTGLSSTKLVKEVNVVRKTQEKRLKINKFDEIWVVFDKDDNKDFEQAIELALSLKYRVAYSNQAFEYWFLLHFTDHQGGAMPRTDYSEKLNEQLKPYGVTFDPKSKHVSEEMFEVLMAFLPKAYDRASIIFTNKKKQQQEFQESVTTIHHLIHSINGMKTTAESRKEEEKKKSMQRANQY